MKLSTPSRSSEIIMSDLKDLRNRALKVWDYNPDLAISANLTNKTVRILEDKLTKMESGNFTVAVETGQAAISTVLFSFLKSGDHVLIPDNVYGPVKLLAENQLAAFNIDYTYYDPLDLKDLEYKITINTRMIYLESPGSLTFEVQDIAKIAQLAKQKNLITVVDNTYATPLNSNPLEYGIDICLHSLSKHITGNTGVFGGSLTVKEREHYKKIKNMAVFLGHWLSPDDALLTLNALPHLKGRLEHQHDTACKVINFLNTHPSIEKIYAPFLATSATYSTWNKFYKKGCGLFSVSLKPHYKEQDLEGFFNHLKVFKISYGWGGDNPLIVPGRTTRSLSKFPPHLIRIYCGMAKPNILIDDLEQALSGLMKT